MAWVSDVSNYVSLWSLASRPDPRQRRRQDLQRGLPVELGVGGVVDLAHAPAPSKPVTR
jgi:hypothetical protein